MKWWNWRSEVAPNADVSALAFEALVNLSCSYDGFQREAAVAELVRRTDPRGIAPLLVRTGDWVAQVRLSAQQGLVRLMRDEFVAHWANALPELAYVYRVQRADLGELIAAIEPFLGRNIDAFEQHAREPDHAMQRWMFALRLAQPHAETGLRDILCHGLRSNELLTSQLCLKAVARLADPAQRREVLEAALRSHLPRVRSAALRELLEGADGSSIARAMCFDRSAAVRALAVGMLAFEQAEVAARAKEILRTPSGEARQCVAALHVLSLLKDPDAITEARVRTASPVVPLRRLARLLLLAAAQAGREDVGAQLLDILADASPQVRRIAVEHVRRGGPLPEVGALMHLGLTRRELARDVLAILGHASPWDRLLFVFELMEGGTLSSELDRTITNEVHVWVEAMGNCYVQPSSPQRVRLARLWDRRARWLSAERPSGHLSDGFPPLVEYHLRAFEVI